MEAEAQGTTDARPVAMRDEPAIFPPAGTAALRALMEARRAGAAAVAVVRPPTRTMVMADIAVAQKACSAWRAFARHEMTSSAYSQVFDPKKCILIGRLVPLVRELITQGVKSRLWACMIIN